MKILLIEKWGTLGHEREPVYGYGGREGYIMTTANHWDCEENVWVDIPDEMVTGFDAVGAPFIGFGDGAIHPIGSVLSNKGNWPVLIRPALEPTDPIYLDVIAKEDDYE